MKLLAVTDLGWALKVKWYSRMLFLVLWCSSYTVHWLIDFVIVVCHPSPVTAIVNLKWWSSTSVNTSTWAVWHDWPRTARGEYMGQRYDLNFKMGKSSWTLVCGDQNCLLADKVDFKMFLFAYRLKKLYIYGVNGIRNVDAIRRENHQLWVEMWEVIDLGATGGIFQDTDLWLLTTHPRFRLLMVPGLALDYIEP